MEITLINGYYIEVDTMNYILKKKYTRKTKDGKEKEGVRVCGYFNGIDNALKRFLEHYQSDCGNNLSLKLDEYVTFINETNKTAVSALKQLLEDDENDYK